MSQIVALWAPDIEPPGEWLIPAILYQDRVATFAPEPYLDDHDGRASRRMADLLGDIYEPVTLSAVFAGSHSVEYELRSRLPLWIATARKLDQRNAGYIGHWADRAEGFDRRRREASRELQSIESRVREARRAEERAAASLSDKRALLTEAEDRLTSLRAEARPRITAAKQARREEIAPLVAEWQVLLVRRATASPGSDDHGSICEALDALRVRIEGTKRSDDDPRMAECRELEAQIGRIRLEAEPLERELQGLRRKMSQLLERCRQQEQRVRHPWSEERTFGVEDLTNLPHGLDTIAVGKVYGRVFDFLATSAGMWVATRLDRPYAGALVGPRFVVEDVMMIIATHLADDRDDCVLMLDEHRRRALNAPTDAAATAAAVSWSLPVPRATDLRAVRAFREGHEDELRVLRDHIRTPLVSAGSPDELREAVQGIQSACQHAAREIAKALDLDRRVGLTHIRGSVVSEIGTSMRDNAVAAGMGAVPVLRNATDGGSSVSGVAAGLLVTGVVLTAVTVVNSVRARSARRRVSAPFLYTYEAMRASDSMVSGRGRG